MYRAAAPRPVTEIAYRSCAMDPFAVIAAAFAALLAIGAIGQLFVPASTRLSCDRTTCTVVATPPLGPARIRTIPLASTDGIELELVRASKGPSSWRENLRVGSDRIVLGSSPERNWVVVNEFEAQRAGRSARFDHVFGDLAGTALKAVACALASLGGIGFLAWRWLREQRLIRIAIDPVRRTVRLGGQEVPIAEIANVTLEYGPPDKRGRVANRLVVVLRDGRTVPVRDFHDHGGGHVAAVSRLTAALVAQSSAA